MPYTPKQIRFLYAAKSGKTRKDGPSPGTASKMLDEVGGKATRAPIPESKETPADERKESAATQKKEAAAGTEQHPEMNPYVSKLKKVAKAEMMKKRMAGK